MLAEDPQHARRRGRVRREVDLRPLPGRRRPAPSKHDRLPGVVHGGQLAGDVPQQRVPVRPAPNAGRELSELHDDGVSHGIAHSVLPSRRVDQERVGRLHDCPALLLRERRARVQVQVRTRRVQRRPHTGRPVRRVQTDGGRPRRLRLSPAHRAHVASVVELHAAAALRHGHLLHLAQQAGEPRHAARAVLPVVGGHLGRGDVRVRPLRVGARDRHRIRQNAGMGGLRVDAGEVRERGVVPSLCRGDARREEDVRGTGRDGRAPRGRGRHGKRGCDRLVAGWCRVLVLLRVRPVDGCLHAGETHGGVVGDNLPQTPRARDAHAHRRRTEVHED